MSGRLTIDRLTRHHPGAVAPTLDALDLEVPAGSCVALLGPSGVGKSTVLHLVAGLDTPDGGDVLIDGRSLRDVPPERRRAVLVFQQPRLFPYLSVLDNVAFPLAVAGARRREARRDASRFLDLVGLNGLSHRYPATLSGGQEQRVALARALAARPEVLLLDEPFSALDPGVRSEMHTLLAELRAAVEPTILVVTHDRHEAAVLADTVAVLVDGRIAQHDTIERLYSHPHSIRVHEFLGGRNAVDGVVAHGAHHSALGSLDLPADVTVADGPGLLVIRQEAVSVTAPGDWSADLTATVTSVSPRGPRALVELAVAGATVVAEVVAWDAPRPGDHVGVILPPGQRHVIPGSRPRGSTDAVAAVAAGTLVTSVRPTR
jgi:putative spermidine/putrescine transport system ATP-binding protein